MIEEKPLRELVKFDHSKESYTDAMGISCDREKELIKESAGIMVELGSHCVKTELWEAIWNRFDNPAERIYIFMRLGRAEEMSRQSIDNILKELKDLVKK